MSTKGASVISKWYAIYFGVSTVLTFTMPSALLVTVMGGMLKCSAAEQIGYLFVLISCIPSMGWSLIAFFVGLSLLRLSEKFSSATNGAAFTALAHCGYYALLLTWCFANNNLNLSFGLHSVESQLIAFSLFSGIYLYALALANFRQTVFSGRCAV